MSNIKGKNIINFKTNEINSHDPNDRLRVLKIGSIFKNFKKGGDIKTNTLYTHSSTKNIVGETKVLINLGSSYSREISLDSLKERSGTVFITPPKEMKMDIEFFCEIDKKNVAIALYNKENNILFSNYILGNNLPITYFDHIADYLKYYKIISNINEEINSVISSNITIGLDGELEPVDKVSFYPFTLRDLSKEQLGCVKMSTDIEAKIGIDNGYGQMELRPGYGQPEDVVNDIIKLMTALKKDKYHISTKGDRYPLGCHIHFGFGFPVKPNNDLLLLLDYFIGIKMMKLSGASRGHFNQKSAARTKAHGFEYRSMPSAIMENPKILKIILNICLTVVKKFNNNFIFSIGPSSFATNTDYKNIGIPSEDIKELNIFYRTYKDITYETNTLAAWTKEKRDK